MAGGTTTKSLVASAGLLGLLCACSASPQQGDSSSAPLRLTIVQEVSRAHIYDGCMQHRPFEAQVALCRCAADRLVQGKSAEELTTPASSEEVSRVSQECLDTVPR
jgi:hypothetical protein